MYKEKEKKAFNVSFEEVQEDNEKSNKTVCNLTITDKEKI